MSKLPERNQQIIRIHAGMIHRVVAACHNRDLIPALEPLIKASLDNGWTALMGAVRRILAGYREPGLLEGLDEEDRVIVDAILRGIRDPASLPGPDQPEPGAAAPGLASMIQASATGNVQALRLLADMAEQMSAAGGDMARLAAIMRRLVNGERDADALTQGMGAQGRGLVLSILEELGKNNLH